MTVRASITLGLILLTSACGADSPDRPADAPAATGSPTTARPPPRAESPAANALALRSAARQAVLERAARRRAELGRLRRSRTVEGALRRALLTHRLTPRAHAGLRAELATARGRARRLPGRRGLELTAVVKTVEGLAARRELTAERIEPVFLVLRRNAGFWNRAPLPVPGQRTIFGSDPVVFQYYAGQGMQLQPLASWGRVNGLAAACLRSLRAARPLGPCRRRRLAGMLDRLTALGVRRGGYLAWEHYFAYGGGQAPWVSGMVQGTAIQALARGRRALGFRRHARAAKRALGAFELPPPTGVAVRTRGGRHYLMYSFAPSLRILNGDLQAVTGLRDAALLLHSPRAGRLYRRGERAARATLASYDTGAWSLYSTRGREATLGYHRLQGGFLADLCVRTGRGAYCAANRRFARYEREPPRIRVYRARGLRSKRPTTVSFRLSKLSTIAVRVAGPHGPLLTRDVSVPRGVHRFGWTPPGRGRYGVRIEARGPSGPSAVVRRIVRVTREDVATERREREELRARRRRADERRTRRSRLRARARQRATSRSSPAPGATPTRGSARRRGSVAPRLPGATRSSSTG